VGHRATAPPLPGAPRGRSTPVESPMTHRPAARFGHLDLRAQAEVPSALRTDTPK
jgi:hypothetical protein